MPLPLLFAALAAKGAGAATVKASCAAASAKSGGAASGSGNTASSSSGDRLFHAADAIHSASELSGGHDKKHK